MHSLPRTAYILQVHKNPNQVNKFIHQLISGEQADVFIHIDKKSLEIFNEKIIKHPHVKVLNKSIDCEWGDISQVDTTLLLLKEVLATNNNYDFICLRSGQDLLVKEGFKEFLVNNKGKIFMSNRTMTSNELGLTKIYWPKITRKRYTTAHPIRIYRRLLLSLYRNNIKLFLNNKTWPKDYLFFKGSQWFTVPQEVARYITKFVDENEWYYEFLKNSMVPDESFFHTLIMNSHYKDDVVNNNLYFFKWGERLSERNSPQYLMSTDIELIKHSDGFFARKFDETIDQQVIEYFSDTVKFARNA